MTETPGGDGRSLQERVDAARSRQGLDGAVKPSPPGNPVDGSVLGLGLRVGAELVAALLVGFAIGWGLDHVFHTKPIFMGIFLLIGGGGGHAECLAPGGAAIDYACVGGQPAGVKIERQAPCNAVA